MLLVGVLVGRAVCARRVALGGLLAHELVVDLLRLLVGDGSLGLCAGLQRAAAPAVTELDDVAAVPGLDARLIRFVGRALPEIERDVLHVVLLSGLWFWVESRKASR